MTKRLVLLTICAFCLITMASFNPRPVEECVVNIPTKAGDTVWNICEEQYDKNEVRDFREFVEDVRTENGLTGNNVLQAGQELRVTKKVRR